MCDPEFYRKTRTVLRSTMQTRTPAQCAPSEDRRRIPVGCPAASVAAGRLVTLSGITSIASSLGARRVAQHALDLTRSHPVICTTVSDAQAIAACLKFADAVRVLVEPACGAALAVPDGHPGLLERFTQPLIEVCGRIGTSFQRLHDWKRSFEL